MAFTNSPQFNTYKTVDVPFVITDQMRSGSLTLGPGDARMRNVYYDPVKNVGEGGLMRVIKRDGIADASISLMKDDPDDELRGFFYAADADALYWAVNDTVYSVVVGNAVRTVQVLNTSSGPVGFCAYFQSDGTQYVAISDGTDLWLDEWAITTVTQVVDPDLPSPHVPTPVYLDGYLLLAAEDTQDIYNSDPDDPFSWSTDNFVQAEINSDAVLRLIKVRNYLVAFGKESIEFFWDAANATGSPFSRNDSAVADVGYLTYGTFIGNQYYFVGQDRKKQLGVFRLDGFKVERISTPVIDRMLQAYYVTSLDEPNRVLTNQDGQVVNMGGHNFYAIRTTTNTWFFDTMLGVWYEWTTGEEEDALQVEASWMPVNGFQYLAISGEDNLSVMGPDIFQDFGVNFTAWYQTGQNWFDTSNWKVCHKVFVKASQVTGDTPVNIVLKWTDDDGETMTAGRDVNIAGKSPYIVRCGRFRRRSWRLDFTENQPLVLEGLKVDINVMGI